MAEKKPKAKAKAKAKVKAKVEEKVEEAPKVEKPKAIPRNRAQ